MESPDLVRTPLYSFTETLNPKYNRPELSHTLGRVAVPSSSLPSPFATLPPQAAFDTPNLRIFHIAPLETSSVPAATLLPLPTSLHAPSPISPLALVSSSEVKLPQYATSHRASRLNSRSPSSASLQHAFLHPMEAVRIRPALPTPPESVADGNSGFPSYSCTVARARTHKTTSRMLPGVPSSKPPPSPTPMSWVAAGPTPTSHTRAAGPLSPNFILVCELCLMTFYQVSRASEHSAEHGEDRPFICHCGCGSAFDKDADRVAHWNVQPSCRRDHQASFVHAIIDAFVPV